MQRLKEKSPFSLAELYMYLQVVRFWEKANYPCVAKVHSLKISVINDHIGGGGLQPIMITFVHHSVRKGGIFRPGGFFPNKNNHDYVIWKS